ncbi:thiamine pyrophosphate-dependent dehydrogenase E1 component subunit alpha [Jatrophihabitans fulvus]
MSASVAMQPTLAAVPDPVPGPEPVQLLRPDGSLDASSPVDLDVTPELCRRLFRDMVVARALDREAFHLQRQGQLGLWLSLEGQEASQIGSAHAVRTSDWIFPSYREHAVGLVRGLTPAQLLTQWRGTAHGGWDPADTRMHIYSLVLGTQTLHATGYAMGVKADGGDEVVLTYVGDGAMSQGDASEALNWSAVTGAPVVFFCQNNQWAISTPVSAQTATPIHRRAAGFGLDTSYVDGNDVLAVYAVTRAAVEAVRAGGRPAFIEALTYRMAGHSTSDDPRRYRDADELRTWQDRDPIARLRTLLLTEQWGDDSWLSEVDTEAADLGSQTRAACLALPEPELEATFAHTLAEETAALRVERQEFTAYRRSLL